MNGTRSPARRWLDRLLGTQAQPAMAPARAPGRTEPVAQRPVMHNAVPAAAAAERPRHAPVMAAAGPSAIQPHAAEVFTPTQPKRGRRNVTGRQAELARILQALWEEKAHVVLYTERGRGKTSLANLVVETLRQGSVIVARHSCEAGDTFDSIVRALARDLPHSLLAVPDSAGGTGCEAALPPGELRPRDVVALPGKLTCRRLVCLIDEFDRIDDAPTRTRIADTIKQLSDGAVPLAFLIVGVSENLEQILGQHPSIQRNLVAVQLPLLSDADVGRMVEAGMAAAGCTLFEGATPRVAAIARGSPYIAQLLGLRLVQAARRRDSTAVSEADLEAAVHQLVAEAPSHAVSAFNTLTGGGTDADMVRALRALVSGEQDVWGRINVVPSFRDGVALGETHVNAATWTRILDAGLVRPIAGEAFRFVFGDRNVMHHILLRTAGRPSLAAPAAFAPNLVARSPGPAAERSTAP